MIDRETAIMQFLAEEHQKLRFNPVIHEPYAYCTDFMDEFISVGFAKELIFGSLNKADWDSINAFVKEIL